MGAESANYPVKRMAGLWGVSRSGFYAWRARRLSKSSTRARVQAELDAKVRLARADSTGTYGAPRIHADLSRNGTGVDRKTVAASMRRHGLEGISPRRVRPVTPISEERVHSIPDLVARKWDTGAWLASASALLDRNHLRTRLVATHPDKNRSNASLWPPQ
jgi:putative transposase